MANVSDWEKGSEWRHVTEDDEAWVGGEVVESIPNKKLTLTWFEPDEPEDVSRISYEIEALDGTVCLTVVHDNFKATSAMPEKVSKGWPMVLSSLKSFLETGKGINICCGD